MQFIKDKCFKNASGSTPLLYFKLDKLTVHIILPFVSTAFTQLRATVLIQFLYFLVLHLFRGSTYSGGGVYLKHKLLQCK